jgi:type III restriction enzyme
MLELKDYQRQGLDALKGFLGDCLDKGPEEAYRKWSPTFPYLPVPGLPRIPYVCLRVPTGGGKTLMACHAVGTAAQNYLQRDSVVCLWLVPSNVIREQTLAALRNRSHPYRQALEADFPGRLNVMDIDEALSVQRGVLDGGATVIVSTLAAHRVGEAELRKVNQDAGALQHHFSDLTEAQREALAGTDGIGLYSLTNVFRLRRPLVIIDEAHNARTGLSFETLSRFRPSCILEFTATPQQTHEPERGKFRSNVLYHVSIKALKDEGMVKIPILLETRTEWRLAVGDAVEKQRRLTKVADKEEKETGEYIRPLVLLQARPVDEAEATVEQVRKCLLEDCDVKPEQIAVATGSVRDLEGVDLFAHDCPIEFIITIQALREGWDCSFAYILCTLANTESSQSVEQILGRILRLPRARKKKAEGLNVAYAYAVSSDFISAAKRLEHGLIDAGFDRFEAHMTIRQAPMQDGLPSMALPSGGFRLRVQQPPDVSKLEADLRKKVEFDSQSNEVVIRQRVDGPELTALKMVLTPAAPAEEVSLFLNRLRPPETFKVPLLGIRFGEQLEWFDDNVLAAAPWNLAEKDSTLSEQEFPTDPPEGEAGKIDVGEEGLLIKRLETLDESSAVLIAEESGWTVEKLAHWLDAQIPHREVVQAHSTLFLHKVLQFLMHNRGMSLAHVAHEKYRLRRVLERKIDTWRAEERKKTYQLLLTEPEPNRLEVRPEVLWATFDESVYAPYRPYQGSVDFRKHYFPDVSDLDEDGEEFRCACHIDSLPEVRYWVRNVPSDPRHSFWLQTSTDRFYPDFVCLLNDGRVLVVEYKGAQYYGGPDAEEKLAIGRLWAALSGGKCLFAMPHSRETLSDINAAIAGTAPLPRPFVFKIVFADASQRFKTHLPVYSLKAAAGKFSGSQDVVEEGWFEVKGRKLDPQMFVAQVVGKSMEPKISNGSYCVFRASPTGSFEGRIVLAQYRGPADSDTGGTYTVKRFRRTQRENPEGGLERIQIWFEPLNSTYDSIPIDPKDNDDVKVVAEFKDVLGV